MIEFHLSLKLHLSFCDPNPSLLPGTNRIASAQQITLWKHYSLANTASQVTGIVVSNYIVAIMLQVMLLVILQLMLIILNKVPSYVNMARHVAINVNVASNVVSKIYFTSNVVSKVIVASNIGGKT